MYGRPGIIYGFHGCDRRTGEAVLASHVQHLRSSSNDYDWLGHGIYFWEASPERGLEFAREARFAAKSHKGEFVTHMLLGQ